MFHRLLKFDGQREYDQATKHFADWKFKEAEPLFRQSAIDLEEHWGDYDHKTQSAKYMLGRTLFELERYAEAEPIFRKAVQNGWDLSDSDEIDKAITKNSLGRTLHKLQKFPEAEKYLRLALQEREKVLGRDNIKTLKTQFYLGDVLRDMERYPEAEEVFRQSLRLRSTVLGNDHEDTIRCKEALARTLYSEGKYAEAERLFQQLVKQQELVLGEDDIHTLVSRREQAFALFNQKRSVEAEQLFRDTIQHQEKVLGEDHVETLQSIYGLACTLHDLAKYKEAEQTFRQLLSQQGVVFGNDHVNALQTAHDLAITLFRQEKYQEAEQRIRWTAQRREVVLGPVHIDTIASKLMLSDIVEMLDYTKAKQASQRQPSPVKESPRTVRKNISESNSNLKENPRTVRKHTSESNSNLKKAQYVAPAAPLSVTEDLMTSLSSQQNDTLPPALADLSTHPRYSKSNVTASLGSANRFTTRQSTQNNATASPFSENSFKDIQSFQDMTTVQPFSGNQLKGPPLTRNRDEVSSSFGSQFVIPSPSRNAVTTPFPPTNPFAALLLSRSSVTAPPFSRNPFRSASSTTNASMALSSSSSLPISQEASRLKDFFTGGKERQIPYTDSEIQQIQLLVNEQQPDWSKTPRTYIILRLIDCLDLMNDFIDQGFSDHWFPVTDERTLPTCLRSSNRFDFVKYQKLIITKSMNLEKGSHCYFEPSDTLPIQERGEIGSGGFGTVDRVLSLISYREYARKRVHRSNIFNGRNSESFKLFIAEIEVLKRLHHHHIVEFVGSYTDHEYLGLIMSPVADMDLSAYLAGTGFTRFPELRTFFGCLAKGLDFLHKERVRHKDIKPSNILVHQGTVRFTDFGLSTDFSETSASTTFGTINFMTAKYCAPEVAMQESRNTSSDIWSLGIVFLEMVTVLKGRKVQYIDEFLKEHGERGAFVRFNIPGFLELVEDLRAAGLSKDNVALGWIKDMLMTKPALRPRADQLVALTVSAGFENGNGVFCGNCCLGRLN
jgi:tetratricopeptide (TPR) repeat protein